MNRHKTEVQYHQQPQFDKFYLEGWGDAVQNLTSTKNLLKVLQQKLSAPPTQPLKKLHKKYQIKKVQPVPSLQDNSLTISHKIPKILQIKIQAQYKKIKFTNDQTKYHQQNAINMKNKQSISIPPQYKKYIQKNNKVNQNSTKLTFSLNKNYTPQQKSPKYPEQLPKANQTIQDLLIFKYHRLSLLNKSKIQLFHNSQSNFKHFSKSFLLHNLCHSQQKIKTRSFNINKLSSELQNARYDKSQDKQLKKYNKLKQYNLCKNPWLQKIKQKNNSKTFFRQPKFFNNDLDNSIFFIDDHLQPNAIKSNHS